MRSPRDVIIAPVVSEKSYEALDEGRYTFVVHPSANKTEIKQAVEQVFGVKVEKVNTLHRRGKRKRFGLQQGRRADEKRAVVTLREGEELDIFEVGF